MLLILFTKYNIKNSSNFFKKNLKFAKNELYLKNFYAIIVLV